MQITFHSVLFTISAFDQRSVTNSTSLPAPQLTKIRKFCDQLESPSTMFAIDEQSAPRKETLPDTEFLRVCVHLSVISNITPILTSHVNGHVLSYSIDYAFIYHANKFGQFLSAEKKCPSLLIFSYVKLPNSCEFSFFANTKMS